MLSVGNKRFLPTFMHSEFQLIDLMVSTFCQELKETSSGDHTRPADILVIFKTQLDITQELQTYNGGISRHSLSSLSREGEHVT